MAKYYRIFDAVRYSGLNLDELRGLAVALDYPHLHIASEGSNAVILHGIQIVATLSPGDYLVFNAGAVRRFLPHDFEKLYRPVTVDMITDEPS